MSDIALEKPHEAYEEQAAPATQVRGYWQSVFYRLRHDKRRCSSARSCC